MNILNAAEKDEELPSTVEKVEQLGHLRITCPKCSHVFEKEDG